MNYLAHAYLSFGTPGIIVGNLVSDFVKGRKKFDFPEDIQKGIVLHRHIDSFTDTHSATREAKEVFRPHYRLYSGAFTDVVFDHFLAVDETEFPNRSLFDLSQQVYDVIDRHTEWLPVPFARMFPYMKSQNWLYNYRDAAGIARSMEGLVRRAAYLSESHTAFKLFEQHYQLLQECYRQLWKDIKPFARQQFEMLNTGTV